jgi:glycosyltransferase involved in cell wall biosynthesis
MAARQNSLPDFKSHTEAAMRPSALIDRLGRPPYIFVSSHGSSLKPGPSGGRVSRTWNIIDSGLSGLATGHHYWEAEALSTELARRGVRARILCSRVGPLPNLPHAELLQLLPLSYYDSVSDDPNWGFLENFVLHNRSYQRALSALRTPDISGSLIVMLSMSPWQFLGAVRWLSGFDDHDRPKSVIVLEPVRNWSADNRSVAAYRDIWAHCPQGVKTDIAFGVRLPALSEGFGPIFGTPPHVLPQPFRFPPPDVLARAISARASEPITFAFLGGARRERGAHLIPEIVARCSEMPVGFLVQARRANPDFEIDRLTALGARPNVRLCTGPLALGDYYGLIAQSVVLLPYDAERYLLRSSGVYHEAKCLGAPVVVSPGTWMAEEVAVEGNGIVSAACTPAAFSEAIAHAARQIGPLRARAASVARDARARHGVGAFVDAVTALQGGLRPPARKGVFQEARS